MLLYHPYKDSNHCTYRLLSILLKLDGEILLDKLKVIDFFYLFPHFLKDIQSWPRGFASFKKHVKDINDPFENTPNKKKLFFDVEGIQNEALVQLASRGIISVERLKHGYVLLEKSKLPNAVISHINEDSYNQSSIVDVLVNGLCHFPWLGSRGLKMRSGLMEFKYDE